MNTKTKNKRQNRGSHLKNIRGSAFRRKFISEWLNNPENDGKRYKDAVQAYIEYKTAIAARWATPVYLLLQDAEPWSQDAGYDDLLQNSKKNVSTVAKALTATEADQIIYTSADAHGKPLKTSGWIKQEDKYIGELTRPSGQTGKWIKKLKTLCDAFLQIKTEEKIVPELKKIIDHCTYKAGNPIKDDKLPLYMYPKVQTMYDEIARRLTEYSKFVTDEMNNSYQNRDDDMETV